MNDLKETFSSIENIESSLLAFEKELLNALEVEIIKHFSGKSFNANGRLLEKNSYRLAFYLDYIETGRELRITFRSNSLKNRYIEESFNIDSYGRIKTVTLYWPTAISRSNRKLIAKISDRIGSAYILLKNRFFELYRDLDQSLHFGLKSIINTHLETGGRASLKDKVFITITNKNTMRFRYSIGSNNLEALFEFFKNLDDHRHSAIDLTIALALGEAGHTINAKFTDFESGKVLHLPSSDFVSFSEHHSFFVAEGAVLDFGELAEHNICETKNHVFQIGVPRKHSNDLKAIIENCSEELTKTFMENENKYNRLMKSLKSVNLRGGDVAYEAGSFMGGLLYGLYKGGLQG